MDAPSSPSRFDRSSLTDSVAVPAMFSEFAVTPSRCSHYSPLAQQGAIIGVGIYAIVGLYFRALDKLDDMRDALKSVEK